MSDATILVVDDEDLIRFTLRQRLEAAGHTVLEAGTGAQAQAHLVDEADVDLVLLDYKLPDARDAGDVVRRRRSCSSASARSRRCSRASTRSPAPSASRT